MRYRKDDYDYLAHFGHRGKSAAEPDLTVTPNAAFIIYGPDGEVLSYQKVRPTIGFPAPTTKKGSEK